jgi:eukaryotic-like serine/threonine-protein kinase
LDYSDAHQAGRRPEVNAADQLGPYALIAEISSGEFTTVHLAHKHGAHGFDRLVAIKRLKPAFARQPEWSQLLLDEARLGASVDHPNTADILDVGTDAGVYVVMDYIEGADLEQLLARAGRERHPRFVLPPLIDALTGLHAIHTQKDELGEPLAMVHQAPRARHILVGIHGTARVTDFSQVTARGLIPSTLRGKGLSPAYMAPEQVLVSEPVSARTDVFILGITLWEALTGQRLFSGETPSLVRRAITERDIPKPSEIGLLPPKCFDGIAMRALQRNPELRYQSAAEMARDLREVAQEEALLASASEVGSWVRALASRSLLERRRALGVDDRSEEIAIDVIEKQIAADRARKERESSIPFARDSIVELVEERPAAPADPAIAVRNEPVKREPTAQLKTPAAATKRSPTGTLLGVTAKPRSVGLPPPAAALQAKIGSAPPYRGSASFTALEAPRIEIKQPAQQLSAANTLPASGAFISDLELPIDLPTAPARQAPTFVGFDAVIDVEAEPVTPTHAKVNFGGASFGGAAATASKAGGLRETNAYGASASMGGLSAPPPSSPTHFNGVSSTLEGVSAPAASWTTPPPLPPAWPAPVSQPAPSASAAWGTSPNAWTTPPAATSAASLNSTREEKRRSEPPARHSRPSMHTLDGNVPKDVFERLRGAGGAESWRPPANAVRQPWQDEAEVEPRGYGRTFAIAAAIAVGGFFGYQQLMGDARRPLPPPSVNAAAPSVEAPSADAPAASAPAASAPAASAPAASAPAASVPAPSASAASVPAPAQHVRPAPDVSPVPAPAVAQPPAVPPVSFQGRQEPEATDARPVKRAAPALPVSRPPVRREEPLARPAPRDLQPAARPRGGAYRSDPIPDNPF